MNRKCKISIICAAAIILNILTTTLFHDLLKIPLFFDTVFTVAVVFYLGLIPGLVVGILFNIVETLSNFLIRGIYSPTNALFAICGAGIVFSTWFFARKKDEFKLSISITILYLLLIALISSFVTIFIGGTIDFLRYMYFEIPDSMAPIRKFTEGFISQRFNLFASCILGQIPISITDRLITTFAGFGVHKLCVRLLGPGEEL